MMEDTMTNKQREELIKKVKKGDSILIIGDTGAGKTELLEWLSGYIEKNRKTVVIGIPDELGKGSVFYPYGGKKTTLENYLRNSPEWLVYDEIQNPDDLNSVFSLWQQGVRVMATVTSGTVKDAGEKLEDLGERMYTAYGNGMGEYIRMFDTVVEVMKGWGGTPWMVKGVQETKDIFEQI